MRFVMAKSFARIHRSNLINSGIIPLVFKNPEDYDAIKLGDSLVIDSPSDQIENEELTVRDAASGREYVMLPKLSELEKKMIRHGGKINMIKSEE